MVNRNISDNGDRGHPAMWRENHQNGKMARMTSAPARDWLTRFIVEKPATALICGATLGGILGWISTRVK